MQDKNPQLSTPNSQLGRVAAGNATVADIIARLPDKPLLTARDLADALYQQTTRSVVAAMEEGRLHAARIGTQYRVSPREARRWIRSLEASK